MFTCIIPTIEKSDKWEKQIPFLVEHNKVDEIIIIKDLPKPEISAYYEFDKIKLFYTGGGYFCNGSWNKGVELAKNAENIILANDDILFNTDVIDRVCELKLEEYGIIGVGNEFRNHISRPFGFGQLMFMKKENYTKIPEGIKHWYGDDWLFYQMSLLGKTNYTIDCKLITDVSESSGSEIVQERIKKDTEWWELNNEPFKQFFWKEWKN